jgi:hypothetical protein
LFDIKPLIKLLGPTLAAIDGRLSPDTSPEVHLLILLAQAALARYSQARLATGPGPGSLGHELLNDLPPESEWTPDGLADYVRTKAPG